LGLHHFEIQASNEQNLDGRKIVKCSCCLTVGADQSLALAGSERDFIHR